ncbi:MAG TPA: phytanoyl-CoA dioxygenase family protein [Stellaceae bacterium]|nr:phytanoyl-CoA dioxygenase family protein [Stellaceae bacterium]
MLSRNQIEQYRYDGYLFPFPALSAAELAECNAGLTRFERWLGKPVNQGDFRWRSASYVMLPWVDALVRHPKVLDVVEELIGPDILVYTATWFIKEAESPTFAAWHQDSTYFGLDPHEHVTAWVAFSEAGADAGCMEVLSSQGKPRQLAHAALRLENSINGAGQAIVEPFDERHSAMMALEAGSFSLHHTLCRHRSAPNRADHRRIGLGISYIPAHCRLNGTVRMCARLVRGKDSGGNFDLIPAPEGELHPAALERHERVYRAYRDNYAEQIVAHEEAFTAAPA